MLALLFAVSRPLTALIERVTTNPWLEVPIYMAIVSTTYSAATFPLSYYSGFVLPHRYGLSVQTLRSWLSDQAQAGALAAALGLPLVEGLYWLLRTTPGTWWIWAGVGMLAVTVGLSTLAPVLILPLFYKLIPLDDAELVRRLTRLAQRAGTRVEGVYTLDFSSRTTAANAGLMGLGRTRRIVVGDTLHSNYTTEEMGVAEVGDYGVISLAVGPDDALWAGTDASGVFRYDGETWTNYTEEDGLAGKLVASIAVTPDGALWFGTYGGLCRYLPPNWRQSEGKRT